MTTEMLPRARYIFVGLVLLVTYISAEILAPCEKADDRLADKQSCTRFHICREDEESPGDFLSDIATCPSLKVFDMVNSTCVDVKQGQGFLQDPAGCNTFYGCRLPSQSSEGYLRTRYTCPGELRFHPEEGHCTHITDVPDTLCNSHIAVQAILGQQTSDTETKGAAAGADDGAAPAGSDGFRAASQSTSLSPNPTEVSVTEPPPTEATVTVAPIEGGDVETFDSNSTTSNGTVFRVVTPGERPAQPLTDIDKIAQVIKGQLLTRRKTSEAASKLK